MGTSNDNAQMQKVKMESEIYGDTLIGNFSAGKNTCLLETLHGLRWVLSSCPQADYVIEARDNTFLRLDKLGRLLSTFKEQGNSRMAILGFRVNSSKVQRLQTSPFFVGKDVLPNDTYPPYCSLDSSYIIHRKMAEEIFKFAWNSYLIAATDAFAGIVAHELGWSVRDSDAFFLRDIGTDVCLLSNRFATLTPRVADIIHRIWDQVNNHQFMRNCTVADLDIIYEGIRVSNSKYLKEVLRPTKNTKATRCKADEHVYIVGLVSSHPESFAARKAIRETWASKPYLQSLKANVIIYFLLGRKKSSKSSIETALREESDMYNDILEGNFIDSFKNLTLKHLFGLQWTYENCASARYFFKADDDIFANLENIVNNLQRLDREDNDLKRLYLGDGGIEQRSTDPNSHLFVSETTYNGKYFPTYCVGGGYVLSMDLVSLALAEASSTPLIPSLDDVYIGILMQKLGVKMTVHDGFRYDEGPTDICALRNPHFMVMHAHKAPDKLKEIWRNFIDPTKVCTQN
ncbi:lactosylceramide 1,3-N-acetyl-beta-D-glucosaminyltransferase-like [Diadema setosum]|uniref:lactosylceramide 1,3-N-acetyl-beta-D-glucosaminyltransferase-like n=1 Tax=Diadema setosum TaxID=31175 RepID=UPI003B3A2D95